MRTIFIFLGVLATWLLVPCPCRADEVVFANGDVLHGAVSDAGDRYVLEHAQLGRLEIEKSSVQRVLRTAPAPAPDLAAPGPGASPAPIVRAQPFEPCRRPTVEEEAVGKEGPWELTIGAGLSQDSGNTEKLKLNFDASAGYSWGRNKLSARARTYYETSDDIQTEGQYFANVRYDREITARGQLFASWTLDRDDFADIELRNGWFVGYARNFIKTNRTKLFGEVGIGNVIEQRTNAPTLYTASLLVRAGYEHEFSKGDTFTASAGWLPYFRETQRSPFRLELLYAHPLRDHLDLTAGFHWDYVPDPPGDIKPYDTKVTFGIRYRL